MAYYNVTVRKHGFSAKDLKNAKAPPLAGPDRANHLTIGISRSRSQGLAPSAVWRRFGWKNARPRTVIKSVTAEAIAIRSTLSFESGSRARGFTRPTAMARTCDEPCRTGCGSFFLACAASRRMVAYLSWLMSHLL